MKTITGLVLLCLGLSVASAGPLDPKGKMHIPIGIVNTVDSLKTFVEAEGNFSPGFGSYGIYFWIYDTQNQHLYAPTMPEVNCDHGLASGGVLIPWASWTAGELSIKSEVCQVERNVGSGQTAQIVASRVRMFNPTDHPIAFRFYAALNSLGAAGHPISEISVASSRDALQVEGHPALISQFQPTLAGVCSNDTVNALAMQGQIPADQICSSATKGGGALAYDLLLQPNETKTFGFICPVHPGCRVQGHQWDGVSKWAQFDLAELHPEKGGLLQPDPGLGYYRKLARQGVDDLFDSAALYWKRLAGKVTLSLPDPRWSEAMSTITAHSAMCMNEGAPDVAVVNFNVFNRDGMYMANIFQKAGLPELSETAIDYFLGHPFNGRIQPEADNPGQILWIMGEHWAFTHDKGWLKRVYPSVQKLAEMIRYYRNMPEPHWVSPTSLDYNGALPEAQRQELKPGACDGFNPAYTEAYDMAGLNAAARLADAMGQEIDAAQWREQSRTFLTTYEKQFGADLTKGYGSYSVLWPCRLYPFLEGLAHEQFKKIEGQAPTDWRYFPLARAHQGLYAGNRKAGYETLNKHLEHPQMHGWYALDEGGDSGVGGWNHVLTTWRQGKVSDAMPHGWAIAEFHLLLRDSLLFEEEGQIVLFSGIPETWFTNTVGMSWSKLPTWFGSSKLRYEYVAAKKEALLDLEGTRPPNGYRLRMPGNWPGKLWAGDKIISPDVHGDYLIPEDTHKVRLQFP